MARPIRPPADRADLIAEYAARIARAFPTLAPGAAVRLAYECAGIARRAHLHAERCCCGPRDVRQRPTAGEAFGYFSAQMVMPGEPEDPTAPRGMRWRHSPELEQQAARDLGRRCEWLRHWFREWTGADVEFHATGHDPRGGVWRALRFRLPGESAEVLE